MSPFATYCPNRPASTTAPTSAGCRLLQLALARAVFAVFPQHPFAVLDDILRDERHHVLARIVESDFADDGVLVARLVELFGDLLAVGTDLLDRIHDQARRRVGERTVGLGRLVVFRLRVFPVEEEP